MIAYRAAGLAPPMQTQPSPLRRKYSSASLPGGPAPSYCRDVDASEPNLDQYLERVAGIDRSDRSSHLARAAILEQATILDYALNELIALPLAVDQAAANLLAFDIFARIPNDVRVGMLETLMKDHDLEDSWPFVIPVLRKVFGLRNRLAHGFVERVDNDRIQITSYNRGKESSVEYSPQELGWLVWQSQVVRTELQDMWVRLLPEDDDWFVVWNGAAW